MVLLLPTTSCLISSFGNTLRSRSRASIWKFFAFTPFGCCHQAIPLLLYGYFRRRYLCASAFVVCVSIFWFSCIPTHWCFKQFLLDCPIVSFSTMVNFNIILFRIHFSSSCVTQFWSDYLDFHKIFFLRKVIFGYSRSTLCLLRFFFISGSTSTVKTFESIAVDLLLLFRFHILNKKV